MNYTEIVNLIESATSASEMKVALTALLDKKLASDDIVELTDRDKLGKLRARVEIHLSD